MPTFGFSAFLRVLSLNDRPQRTAIRNRLRPSAGGYDYHRSLHLRAHRYLVDGEDIAAVLASCEEITNASEQRSAYLALQELHDWREEHPGPILDYQPKLFESPGEVFKVHFTPNFGLRIDDVPTAVHVWNTAHPPLVQRMVYAALSLFPELYAAGPGKPGDLAVLSLRDSRLYSLREAAADYALLGGRVVAALETIIREIGDDLGLPAPSPGPHPPGP